MLYPPDIMHLIFFLKLILIHKFESIIAKINKICLNMLYIALFSSHFVSAHGNFTH